MTRFFFFSFSFFFWLLPQRQLRPLQWCVFDSQQTSQAFNFSLLTWSMNGIPSISLLTAPQFLFLFEFPNNTHTFNHLISFSLCSPRKSRTLSGSSTSFAALTRNVWIFIQIFFCLFSTFLFAHHTKCIIFITYLHCE